MSFKGCGLCESSASCGCKGHTYASLGPITRTHIGCKALRWLRTRSYTVHCEALSWLRTRSYIVPSLLQAALEGTFSDAGCTRGHTHKGMQAAREVVLLRRLHMRAYSSGDAPHTRPYTSPHCTRGHTPHLVDCTRADVAHTRGHTPHLTTLSCTHEAIHPISLP